MRAVDAQDRIRAGAGVDRGVLTCDGESVGACAVVNGICALCDFDVFADRGAGQMSVGTEPADTRNVGGGGDELFDAVVIDDVGKEAVKGFNFAEENVAAIGGDVAFVVGVEFIAAFETGQIDIGSDVAKGRAQQSLKRGMFGEIAQEHEAAGISVVGAGAAFHCQGIFQTAVGVSNFKNSVPAFVVDTVRQFRSAFGDKFG